MIKFLKRLFGIQQVNIESLIKNGAVIIDVRSEGEFKSGHLKNSMNIPLDKLIDSLKKLDKAQPIITCCASGMRSISAKSILKSRGFTKVYNGGGWAGLKQFEN